jgi:hypothetical protein
MIFRATMRHFWSELIRMPSLLQTTLEILMSIYHIMNFLDEQSQNSTGAQMGLCDL